MTDNNQSRRLAPYLVLAFLLWPPLSALARDGSNYNPANPSGQTTTADAGGIPQGFARALKTELGGLDVAIWQAHTEARVPLIIFSHGFGGSNTQSDFLMGAFAEAGYLVVAPDHKDARGLARGLKPQIKFSEPKLWSATTYEDRHQDIVNLLRALHADSEWNKRIDWDRVGLCGHSLGGYTVLGLAGAWPQWKLDSDHDRLHLRAVLALSPFAAPFADGANPEALKKITVPVMYQGGTTDFFLTPAMKRPGGTYDQTNAPAYLVVFKQAGHLAWTKMDKSQERRKLIDDYSVAFFNKYLKGDAATISLESRAGVDEIRAK